ncbi:MAG: nucleotidyltransferase substrate binding protein [Alphaproteobacteria bacterium]|nr:nucleotidyltransferase substrate binding protein [Alphaproteobacteria bacterium]
MNEILDVSSLEKAIKSLDEALKELKKDNRSFIKDSVVQRFEYTYELCHKFFKRYLKIAAPSMQDLDEMPFQSLIRTANKMGMFLSDLEKWKNYRNARNITSHTYDSEKSEIIVAIAPEFYEEAVYFFNKLKTKLEEIGCQ